MQELECSYLNWASVLKNGKVLSERPPKKAGKEGRAKKEWAKAHRTAVRCGQRACKEREQAVPCSAAALSWHRVGSQNLQVRNFASGCVFAAQKQ